MDSRVRHLAKTITWRVIATSTTLGTTAFVQDKQDNALPSFGLLAIFDVFIKMLFYYWHERIWFTARLDIGHKTRHIIKAFSWRIIASLTTFILVIILFRNEDNAVEKGMIIAAIEFILKIIFYYGHEEVWYRVNLGLDSRRNKSIDNG